MAWPCEHTVWGDMLQAARDAFAQVAREISRFEPVTMIVRPPNLEEAQSCCGPQVECIAMEHDDSWARDSGPSFLVHRTDGTRAGVDWVFNAWGGKYHPHNQDAAMAERILAHCGVRRYASPLVLEGGSIHVDGEGTLITTEQCLLNKNRNPSLTRSEIEEHLRKFLDVRKIIWLQGDPLDDETDGHVDNLACFAAPGLVLAQHAGSSDRPNHSALAENLSRLQNATDACGRRLKVVELPLPQASLLDHRGAPLLASYVNFYLANGAVIAPAFDVPADKVALGIFKEVFPDREIVQVPALAILHGGGGIHCITQQEPAAPVAKPSI